MNIQVASRRIGQFVRCAAPSSAAPAKFVPPSDTVTVGTKHEGGSSIVVSPAREPRASTPQPGTDGMADPYYPQLGNGGYDAQHYTIDLSVDVDGNRVQGTSTMDATATQDLSAFNLDFRGFDIAKITVNGADAQFSRDDGELTVTPSQPLQNGRPFQVAVNYSGKPQPFDSQAIAFTVGWKKYNGGASVDSEPDGASSWFPVNDHPRDKATYTFKIDVPKGYTVAANGTLQQTEDHDDRTRFTWEAKDPMASYLATVQIGDFVRQDETSPSGVHIRNYFPPDRADAAKYDFGRTGEMIEHFGKLFGPYPFEAYGAVVIPRSMVGGALECQTMSIFDPFVVSGDRSTENVIAHELTHQWFGDAVSVKNWKDIWLNEGFASYGEWLWQEKTQGLDSVKQTAHEVYDWLKGTGREIAGEGHPDQAKDVPECVRKLLQARRHGLSQQASGPIKIGEPPRDDLFNELVYVKGALTLYALRQTVGDDAFFSGLQTYFSQFRGGNAEIADFQSVMEKASGHPLGDFFKGWLYQTEVPPLP